MEILLDKKEYFTWTWEPDNHWYFCNRNDVNCYVYVVQDQNGKSIGWQAEMEGPDEFCVSWPDYDEGAQQARPDDCMAWCRRMLILREAERG